MKESMGAPQALMKKKVTGKKLKEAQQQVPIVLKCTGISVDSVDKKVVPMLGTSFYCRAPVIMITTEKMDMSTQTQGGRRSKNRYEIQHAYNHYMHGVDTMVQLISNFSTYIRSRKWWKRLYHWMFDIGLTNGYICSQEEHGPS